MTPSSPHLLRPGRWLALFVLAALLTGCAKKQTSAPTPSPAPVAVANTAAGPMVPGQTTPPPAPVVGAPSTVPVPVGAPPTGPWEAVSQRNLFRGHQGAVLAVAFSPDGKRVLSGSADRTVRLWDLATRQPLCVVPTTALVSSVSFAPDGKRFLFADVGGSIRVWDATTTTPKEERSIPAGTSVNRVAFSADGKTIFAIASGYSSGKGGLRRFETLTGKELPAILDRTGIRSGEFSPDARRAAFFDSMGTEVWDLETPRLVATLGTNKFRRLAVGSDRILANTSTFDLELWKDGTNLGKFGTSGHLSTGVALSPDGKRGLAANSQHTLELWDLEKARQPLKRFEGHKGTVICITISADGKRAASASTDRTVRIWDLEDGREVANLSDELVTWIEWEAWTVDYRWVLVPGAPTFTTLHLWDTVERRELRRLTGHTGKVVRMTLSGDGKQAATASEDGTIRVWDLTTGKETSRIDGQVKPGKKLVFSTDGKQLLVREDERTMVVWDVATRKEVVRFTGPTTTVTTFTVVPGTKQVLLGSEQTAYLWNVSTGIAVRQYPVSYGSITSLTLSPDQKQLLATTTGRTQHLWEVDSGRVLTGTEWGAPWVTQTRTVLVRHLTVPTTTTTYVPGTTTYVPGTTTYVPGTTTRTTTIRTYRIIRRR